MLVATCIFISARPSEAAVSGTVSAQAGLNIYEPFFNGIGGMFGTAFISPSEDILGSLGKNTQNAAASVVGVAPQGVASVAGAVGNFFTNIQCLFLDGGCVSGTNLSKVTSDTNISPPPPATTPAPAKESPSTITYTNSGSPQIIEHVVQNQPIIQQTVTTGLTAPQVIALIQQYAPTQVVSSGAGELPSVIFTAE